MTTRAIQHIPAHLSFGAVTCNSDNYLASVVIECFGLTCPSLPPISMSFPFSNSIDQERRFGACRSIGTVPLLRALSHRRPDPLDGFLQSRFLDVSHSFMTPGVLGLAIHDLNRGSSSPSTQCTASRPAAASFRTLCTFRTCISLENHHIAVHTLAIDVKVSHSARGYDIRMQSQRVSAPRPVRLLLVLRHIPHRHSWSSFRSGANRVRN